MDGPNGMLIPLKNNAAGKMTGLEVVLRSLVSEYFPRDTRSKGFNVSGYFYIRVGRLLDLKINNRLCSINRSFYANNRLFDKSKTTKTPKIIVVICCGRVAFTPPPPPNPLYMAGRCNNILGPENDTVLGPVRKFFICSILVGRLKSK